MSLTANKSLIIEVYDHVINQRDFDRFLDLTAEHYTDHSNPATFMPTRDGTLLAWRMMARSFPDLKVEILDMIAEGDRVAVRVQTTGSHAGAFGPFGTSGTKLDFESTMFWRIEGGKLTERWALTDTGPSIRQFGLAGVAL